MFVLLLLGSLVLLAPLPFGSVHQTSYTLWSFIISAGCLFVWLHPRKPISLTVKKLMLCIGLLASIGLVARFGAYLFAPQFPVEGIYSVFLDPKKFWTTQWMLLLSLLVAYLSSQLTSAQRYHLLSLGMASGLIVSTIALAQWLSDNGKLFWIFEPTFASESTRARWPFVNPNHLGAFLIIPFFLCLSRFASLVRTVQKELEYSRFRSYMSTYSRILTVKEFPRTVVYGIALSWIGVAIIASQSRAVFITVLTLSIFVTLTGLSPQGMKSRRIALWAIGLIVLIGAFVLFDQRELIRVRLQYGLLAAKDDIRWEMYKESLPLITPFGVGLGGWERSFLSIASPSFVGLNPEFLHSDPLQFLVEAGLIGLFIILFLMGSLIRRLFIDAFKGSLGFLAAGILGVIIASFFDFPFRIPAISWVFVIFLVSWLNESEKYQLKEKH